MMTSSRPDSSTSVRKMLALTLSPTPRRFTAATTAMKISATLMTSVALVSSSPKPTARFEAKARDAVEAEVMPEHMTVKQTMNVSRWTPNALCV
jgi:hypothetical protein